MHNVSLLSCLALLVICTDVFIRKFGFDTSTFRYGQNGHNGVCRGNQQRGIILDPDSDPEFNGGAFIPPPKAKKGRKSKTADAVSSRKNGRVQRRSDILDGIEHYGVAKSKVSSEFRTLMNR